MDNFFRHVLFLMLTVFLATLVACTGANRPDQPIWVKIPITDIKQVMGKWEGVTWFEPRTRRQEDWVKVKINEEGQFEFASYRTIGAWLGNGRLILEQDILVTEPKPDAGTATFTLYESNGKRMLKVQGTTKTGRRQGAELNPAKK